MSVDRILSQLLGSSTASGFAGGLAGGLASSLLTSKAGRKLGKQALKVGGIAAVGGLAYAAWSRYGRPEQQRLEGNAESEAAAGPPPIERFVPAVDQPAAAEDLGSTLLRAMISAAQADGSFDSSERRAVFAHVASMDLSDPEKAELLTQLTRPVDMGVLVAAATTPEIAAEIYAASLLAIDIDTPAERAYMAMLAARLDLPEGLVRSLHQELGVSARGDAVHRALEQSAP